VFLSVAGAIVNAMTTSTKFDTSGINSSFLGSHAISEGDISRHQLRSPLFTQLFHNVYVPAWVPISHELRCRAAARIAPATATLTGCSAAAVYGFGFALPYDDVELVVEEEAKFTAKRGMHIRRTTIELAEGEPWETIRLATPLRTALDILCNTKLRRSLPRTVGLLDVLLREEFFERDELDALLQARHDRGIIRARRCLQLADPRAESIPESEVRVWLVLGGLEPELQINVHNADGRFLGRLDLGFPEVKLAVEYDGKWHDDPEQQRHDALRRGRMEADGWEFIVVTQEWLREDPRGMVDAIREALQRRS